jgi:uncharacterized protein (DUF1800 family)
MSRAMEEAESGASEPAAAATEQAPSRRQLFKLGAAALASAALLTPRKVSAQRIVRPHTMRPPPPPSSGDSLLRLVRRATNGLTQEEVSRARQIGFSRYLDYQIKYQSIKDTAVDTYISTKFPLLASDGLGLYQQDQNALLTQLSEATLYRAAFSKRQLYERMVNFWTDHFNIYYPKVNYLKVIDDREVIRKHALGKFPALLKASAHSPAMLEYLDNTRSRGRNVNQNYARELMELHTLGVDGGYTQTDVEEVTRCLTGWTIAGRGNFNFDPTGHDFTAKTVLGTVIPAQAANSGQGQQDGEKVLDLLINHPSTAKYISFKMARWLLQYDPPAELVTKVAATYTRTGGDIPSMIKDILTPDNLTEAPAKYRQPYQLVLASLRAAQPTITSAATLSGRELRVIGQPLYLWEDPDGYPDNVDWWAGGILQRWNFCSTLALMGTGAVIVDVATLMKTNTPAGIVDAIDFRAFGGEMPDDLKLRLTSYLSAQTITTTRVREAFALALSSTAFQWY